MITARKRGLGQGNVFTPVCHSVHKEGGIGFLACITSHMTRGAASRWSASRGSASGGGYTWGGADPLPSWDTMGYGQQVGGMHPTGMQSCRFMFRMR